MSTLLHTQDDYPQYEIEDRQRLNNKLKSYHIHVYAITQMIEVNVTAKDDDAALELSLIAASKNKNWKKADCNVIAEIQKEREDAPTDEVSPNLPK